MVGGMLLVMLGSLLVTLLVGGLILKGSVRLVEGFAPGYGRSVLAVLAASLASFALSAVVSLLLGLGGSALGTTDAGGDPTAAMAALGAASLLSSLVSVVATFVLMALAVHLLVPHPDGRRIGAGRACLVSLLYLVIFIVLAIVVGIVLAMVFGAALMGLAGAT